jgi:hypothetical protein
VVLTRGGKAELLAEPSNSMMAPGFGETSAHLFPRIGSTPEQMAAKYSQVISCRPSRVQAWGIGGA